jgi:hypothetical protein
MASKFVILNGSSVIPQAEIHGTKKISTSHNSKLSQQGS